MNSKVGGFRKILEKEKAWSGLSEEGRLDRETHCKEDLIYVFPEIKLRGLVLNSYIHVSVSDLYIPLIGPPVLLISGPIMGIYKSL